MSTAVLNYHIKVSSAKAGIDLAVELMDTAGITPDSIDINDEKALDWNEHDAILVRQNRLSVDEYISRHEYIPPLLEEDES